MTRRHVSPAVAALATVALLATAGRAGADTIIETDPAGDLRADAGYLVTSGAERAFSVRRTAGTEPARERGPRRDSGVVFDVGRGPSGGATIAWVDRCSKAGRRCTIKAMPAAGGAARVLATVPYGGLDVPAIALDGSRLAYTSSVARGDTRCDALHVRGLGRGGRTRRLDSGFACGLIGQVEIEGRWVAFGVESDIEALDGEVRAVRSDGSRRSIGVDYAGSAESLEFLDGLAIDGGVVYTTHRGNRREHFVRRVSLRTGARSDAKVFGDLGGGFARDGGHQFLRQNATTLLDPIDGIFGENACLRSFVGPACLLVAADDPWAGRRRLLPDLTMGATEGTLPGGGAATVLAGGVTRRTADRRRRSAARPVAGAAVTVARLEPDGERVTVAVATARTDGAGAWSVTVPAVEDATYRALVDVPGVGAPVGSDEVTPAG